LRTERNPELLRGKVCTKPESGDRRPERIAIFISYSFDSLLEPLIGKEKEAETLSGFRSPLSGLPFPLPSLTQSSTSVAKAF
jgi:hypothetical protein